MPSRSRSARPGSRLTSLLACLVVAGTILAGLTPGRAAASSDVGYSGPSYGTASAPTGQKPQSKLWWNDGLWWGSLFSATVRDFTIHRLDWASQRWIDTGVVIDERSRSQADALWDGSRLWVATAQREGSKSGDLSARIVRFSYDATTRTYSRDSGFPVTVWTGAIEAMVLDRDSTGMIWVTWTSENGSGGRNVYLTHSTGPNTFRSAYILPLPQATTLDADDISTLVSYNGKIGVMWSNQTESSVYFASHVDGTSDMSWTLNPALQGPKYADDHINIKSLQADASGQVFAVVKTSLNDVNPPTSSQPLILVLTLDNNGSWKRTTFSRVSDNHTRPLLLIDNENRQLYVFAASPCCSGGVIYYKQTSLDNPSFAPGIGSPFIRLASDTTINNPTSTKQALSTATGLVVLAGDDRTSRYVHNAISLGGGDITPPAVTSTAPAGGATGVAASTSVTATFSEAIAPASVTPSTFTLSGPGGPVAASASQGPGAQTATLTPSTALLASTTYTATLRGGSGGITDLAGNALSSDVTWSFTTGAPVDTTPPTVSLSAPAQGATVSGVVTISASASDDVGVTRVDFLVRGVQVGSDPSAPYEFTWDSTTVADGAAVITARAIDAAGNAATSSASVTVANAPTGALFSDGFESGSFAAWTQVRTGADGTATVQSQTVRTGSFAARLTSTSATGSYAYARSTLDTSQTALTVSGDFQVTQAGASNANVPILRLFDASGARVLSLYRQNGTSDQIWVWDASGYRATTGRLPLGTWGRLDLVVTAGGTGSSTVEVRLDGVVVNRTTTATVPAIRTIQIGNETTKQAGSIVVDNVMVTN
ncbi:MAG: Ig-like domain-containing protein [Chloroflexi bacterium]|nr:Ig-like domain-containing protein [Chloroflexota bacterium]